MDLELGGKTAIITGGSRGIGKAVAHALAREGVRVALIARDLSVAKRSADEIAARSHQMAAAYAADTADDAAVRAAIDRIARDLGRIDILVNAAAQPGGQSRPPKLAEITNDHFWADMNVKVMGYLRCARAAAPYMTRQHWGRIINISGLAARQTGSTIGSIRNIAVAALTKNLADELGPLGINVTCVHPGLTRTEKTAGVLQRQAQAQGLTPDEIENRWAGLNLIRRIVTAEEVADVVAFLASPRSVAINGDAIAAGGGTPGAIHY
ncbi:MAG TPA: SDR family oxidoreductase [Micropepsaceae bacterium]|nr:SDR family oxidoreductase [Micropepsaceae bacterium]